MTSQVIFDIRASYCALVLPTLLAEAERSPNSPYLSRARSWSLSWHALSDGRIKQVRIVVRQDTSYLATNSPDTLDSRIRRRKTGLSRSSSVVALLTLTCGTSTALAMDINCNACMAVTVPASRLATLAPPPRSSTPLRASGRPIKPWIERTVRPLHAFGPLKPSWATLSGRTWGPPIYLQDQGAICPIPPGCPLRQDVPFGYKLNPK